MATTYHAGRRIWTRQPNRVLQVATGPSNTAPALAWNAAVPWVNQATGKAMQAMNGARQRAGVPGIGIRFASSTNAGIKVDGPNLLKGSAGNWSAGLTVYLLADPPANTTRSLPFAFSDNATQPQSYFGFNVDLSLAASSGRWSVTDGAAGSYASGVLDGKPHVFCAVFGGSPTGPSLYVDGKLRNTAGNSIGDYAGAGQDIWIGGYSSGSWAASDYSVYGVFAFNESHTTDQVARVSASFWQQYEPERIWVPVSAGGGPDFDLTVTVTDPLETAAATFESLFTLSTAVDDPLEGIAGSVVVLVDLTLATTDPLESVSAEALTLTDLAFEVGDSLETTALEISAGGTTIEVAITDSLESVAGTIEALIAVNAAVEDPIESVVVTVGSVRDLTLDVTDPLETVTADIFVVTVSDIEITADDPRETVNLQIAYGEEQGQFPVGVRVGRDHRAEWEPWRRRDFDIAALEMREALQPTAPEAREAPKRPQIDVKALVKSIPRPRGIPLSLPSEDEDEDEELLLLLLED